ncbi:hypothetical protein CPB85DRAFT_157151 [Mucidula mucida]|nr:hypothetical protein CPB85DRAFT_157151 [Mucidula mucida]
MRDLPDDEVEVFAAFRAKIHNSSKIEAEKTAKWTKAVRKRDVILQVLKFENTIDIEVRHVQPRLGRDIDAPHLYKVGECMMHDTFDIVLLRWIMQDKAISLRSNPHFYDNLEHPGYRVSERRDALVFSKTLSDYGATRKRAETERIIIHCITDAHNHPLILFKHIAGWRFGQLCRFKDVILLKGTSGLLVEVTWFQDQLDQAVSLKITKRERSRETASLSVSWETLLDEVIKARRRDTQFTWIIENDAGDLLKKDSPKSIYLTVSAEGLGSSRQTLVPFNAQSKISLVPSEMTLVSPPDAESLPSKFRRSVDAFGSPNLQDPRRGDVRLQSYCPPLPSTLTMIGFSDASWNLGQYSNASF